MVGARREARRVPGAKALLGSILLHGLAVAVFWLAGFTYASPLPPMKTYKVNIVSPPPAEAGPIREEVPADPEPPRPTPQETPPQEPEPQPVVVPEPQPPEEKTPPRQEQQRREPPREEPPETKPPEQPPVEQKREEQKREEATPPAPRAATGANPDPDAAEHGSGLNIRLEGEVFPFPGYLEGIALQIGRFFRWTGDTGLSAEIYFEIMRDGSVQGIRLLRGSGNAAFNLQAMGAIEQAGRRRAFGPLPDGYTGDRLPVSFYFQPAR